MISLGAAIVRAALRAYTYPYRKRFASLSRSVVLKEKPYEPPKGFSFAEEEYGGVRVEKIVPPECGDGAVLQFHGGGHTVPMNEMYRNAAERLAAACGCTVYSIDYRTGAHLTYPAVHDECFRAYAALCKSVLRGGKFVAIGDSFGANLLLSACLRAREGGLPLPSAIVCISCFIDMAASGDSYRENCYRDPLYGMPRRYDFEAHEKKIRRISPYCGSTPLNDPDLSPAYADLQGFPKALILCGGWETSLTDSRMLYDGLQKGGSPAKLHVFPGMWHDFLYLFPRLKESRAAWREIVAFITEALSPNGKQERTMKDVCALARKAGGRACICRFSDAQNKNGRLLPPASFWWTCIRSLRTFLL